MVLRVRMSLLAGSYCFSFLSTEKATLAQKEKYATFNSVNFTNSPLVFVRANNLVLVPTEKKFFDFNAAFKMLTFSSTPLSFHFGLMMPV